MVTANLTIPSEEFYRAVAVAFKTAAREALANGVSIFYTDKSLNIMEQPDGRRFEIRFIPGGPDEENYEVLREIARQAA